MSSSFNAPTNWFLCSDVSAKLLVLKDQGVCWNEEINDCSMGFVPVTRSNTAVHMFTPFAFVRTSFMSGAIYSIFRVFEVI